MALPDNRQENIRMIRESVGGLLPRGDLARVRAQRFKEPGFSRDVWREMCAMGWLGLMTAEEEGGAGLGMAEFCVLAEELGRGLAPEPLIAAASILPFLDAGQKSRALDGGDIILPAFQERAGDLQPGRETASDSGGLRGAKIFVHQAKGADAFVVPTSDGVRIVDAKTTGVTLDADECHDGGFLVAVDFADAQSVAAGDGDLERACDEATLATAAYLLGVMDRAFEITLDYLRTREQFGRAIGSFQALQHRAADMKIQIELTRASVAAAALAVEGGNAKLRAQGVSRAKARASGAAMLIAREAIQMHGAIGYTDESDIGLYARKAMTLANLYGSASVHRRRFGEIANAA